MKTNHDFHEFIDARIYEKIRRASDPDARVFFLLIPPQDHDGRINRYTPCMQYKVEFDRISPMVPATTMHMRTRANRVFNLTVIPEAQRRGILNLIHDRFGDAATTKRTSLKDWLSSRPRCSSRGAPMGMSHDDRLDGLAFHCEKLYINSGGYLVDGTYLGARMRGEAAFAAYQDPTDGSPRRLIASTDARTREQAIAYFEALLGLPYAGNNGARTARKDGAA